MIRNFLNCLKAIRVDRRFYSNSYRIAGVKTCFEIWYGQNELELASQLYALDREFRCEVQNPTAADFVKHVRMLNKHSWKS